MDTEMTTDKSHSMHHRLTTDSTPDTLRGSVDVELGGHKTLPHGAAATVTLTNAQFEQLYLQPKIVGKDYTLNSRFGNPTPLGTTAFLLAHTPLTFDLLGFQGASGASAVAVLGSFYGCAGIGLYLACIGEWIIGNTFPCVVFGTYGGFWISYAVLIQPSFGIAGSLAPAADAGNSITAQLAGSSTVAYNTGVGLYFIFWGLISLMYFICALRTNVPFATVFISLVLAFELIAGGFMQTAKGNLTIAAHLFKAGGAFAFVTVIAALWIDFSLLLASVGYPGIPLIDLSKRVVVKDPWRRENKDA